MGADLFLSKAELRSTAAAHSLEISFGKTDKYHIVDISTKIDRSFNYKFSYSLPKLCAYLLQVYTPL